MLTHSFRRNMTRAVLIAGDRDFKPVVEALVANGTDVHVVCQGGHNAAALTNAADSSEVFDISHLCRWTKYVPFFEIPCDILLGREFNEGELDGAALQRVGRSENHHDVLLYERPNTAVIVIKQYPAFRLCEFRDREKLMRYVAHLEGKIAWDYDSF